MIGKANAKVNKLIYKTSNSVLQVELMDLCYLNN